MNGTVTAVQLSTPRRRTFLSLGMGLGLLLGATVVGFRTPLADLAVMGALTGGMLGVTQAFALAAQTRRRW